jgi:general secretion pathway protein G
MKIKNQNKHSAFTIVELLIVIVIIGVLAAISILSYNGVTDRAKVASLKSDLSGNATQLKLYNAQYGSYPTALDANKCPSAPNPTTESTYCLRISSSNSLGSYSGTITGYSLKLSNSGTSYGLTESSTPFAVNTVTDGSYIQIINRPNCPSTRTRAVDARDSHTYWVQQMGDGKCWMLTNLGYAGGGTNTYGDVKTLTNGTALAATYTTASYYVVPATTNYTTEPTAPATAVNGTGQFGYLYNWCGAMAGQATAACNNTTTPDPDVTISICPSGWRLPTVSPTNEFTALNSVVNAGSFTTDAGWIASPWLGQRSGRWVLDGFYNQNSGGSGFYWASTQVDAFHGYSLNFDNIYTGYVNTADPINTNKPHGAAVRCVAS